MRPFIRLSLATVSLLSLGTALSAAADELNRRCIEPSLDLVILDRSPSGSESQELFVGAVSAHFLADAHDPISGHPTFDASRTTLLLFKTQSGRFFVQETNVPPGHGWFGPF